MPSLSEFNLLTHRAAAAHAQAHQPGGEHAKIFHFPGVAIAQTHTRRRYQHALVLTAAYIRLGVTEGIGRRTRSITQFGEAYISLIKDGEFGATFSLLGRQD